MRVEVVTIGEAMALLLAPDGVPLGEAAGYDHSYAGAESNVAVGLARLGHSVAFVSRLGADHLGRRVLRELRGEGVDIGSVSLDPARATGLLLRDTLAHGISVEYHRAGSAATGLAPEDLPLDVIHTARLLHVTGITAAISASAYETVLTAARTAREHGVVVSVDPNVRLRLADAERWRAITEELTDLADVLLIGAEDARAIGIADPIGWAHGRGVGTVVLKDGARGATESHGSATWHAPALPVSTVVDPVGAGDAFAAGWLSAWLRGVEPDRRLCEAAAVAACVVGSRGDVPGLPDAATLTRLLTSTEDVRR